LLHLFINFDMVKSLKLKTCAYSVSLICISIRIIGCSYIFMTKNMN